MAVGEVTVFLLSIIQVNWSVRRRGSCVLETWKIRSMMMPDSPGHTPSGGSEAKCFGPDVTHRRIVRRKT